MNKIKMASSLEKSDKKTREKILDVLFRLVYIYGYHGTSMSMILKECNIPKGSLYHHFASKKEMVLAVLKERIVPRIEDFYELNSLEEASGIETLIDTIVKISSKDELVMYGCPLNRLNQEMAVLDEDFEYEINLIYEKMRMKLKHLLAQSNLKKGISHDSLAEFIIGSVWGNLALSPKQSSQQRYLASVSHLIAYLQSLTN